MVYAAFSLGLAFGSLGAPLANTLVSRGATACGLPLGRGENLRLWFRAVDDCDNYIGFVCPAGSAEDGSGEEDASFKDGAYRFRCFFLRLLFFHNFLTSRNDGMVDGGARFGSVLLDAETVGLSS